MLKKLKTVFLLLIALLVCINMSCAEKDKSTKSASETDITAPSAPTNLSAIIGKKQITLYWISDPVSVTDINKYRVYRSISPILNSDTYTEKGYIAESGKSFTDTNIILDTTYYYRVSAIDKAGNESSKSNQVEVKCTDNEVVPSAPTNLLAAADKNQISLTWGYASDTDINNYRLYRSTSSIPNSAAYTEKGYVEENGKSYIDTEVILDTTYYYRVSAVDISGKEGSKSNQVEVKCTDKKIIPSAPTNLTATADKNQILLIWGYASDTDISNYRLYRSTLSISNSTAYTEKGYAEENGKSYIDTEIMLDTTYYYRVSAVDINGKEGSKSNQVEVTISDSHPPLKPAGLAAQSGSNKGEVNLSWTANAETDLNGYNIYKATQAGGNFSFVAISLTNSYTVTGLNPGQIYYFKVEAVDTANNISISSDIIAGMAKGDSTAPSAPSGLTATPGASKQIVLDWNDNSESDLSKYNIYQSSDGISYSKIDYITGTPPLSTYTVSGLTTGTYYYFTVSAVDISNNESEKSSRSGASAP